MDVVDRQDINLTRDDVHKWIKQWKKKSKKDRGKLRDHLHKKLEEMEIADKAIIINDEKHSVLEYLLDDIKSYGESPDS